MLPPVAEGPAVEAAVPHRGEIVGDKIAAQFVTLVDDRPQHAGLRLPSQAVGVAQAGGEQPRLAVGAVDLQDRGASLLLVEAVLPDVAVGPYAGVEARPVGAGDQCL